MTIFVGLDVGTTTVSAVVMDVQAGRVLAGYSADHSASRWPPSDGNDHQQRAELDLVALQKDVLLALEAVCARAPQECARAAGLGVTGQQHGLALLDASGHPFAPAITWQDRRVLAHIPGRSQTYLERFISLAGGPAAFERTGCLPAAGYLGPTLFWLVCEDALPKADAIACFVPDAVVSFLTGAPPHTDATDGGSSGIFDVVSCTWDRELARRVGLPLDILAPVGEAGTPVGGLRADLAGLLGLPAGLPVGIAMGDNQASFLGSVRDPADTLLLNVGTGAQISAWIPTFQRLPDLDTRAFPGGHYLLVGAALFGGRSYAYLEEFLRRVGTSLFDCGGTEPLYSRMNALAAAVPAGSGGLTCSPLFTGSRADPAARASFSGITPANLTPGHMARALLEGIAEGFGGFYEHMAPVLGHRCQLVGSGNGVRRNPLLARILAARFGMPLAVPAFEQAAAAGAALVAAVGNGSLPSVAAAMQRVRFSETYQPDTM